MSKSRNQIVRNELARLGFSWIYSVDETPSSSWVLEARRHDVTLDDLAKISMLFGTTKINIGSEAREGGYCDTCRHSYSVSVITVMEAATVPGLPA